MGEIRKVPKVVINRLPRYYRHLGELLSQGITKISSTELSERMGVTASQIRQDFNFFGGFGQQGYGYNIEYLYSEIAEILGLNDGNTIIIVGAGNLGRALANHSGFEKRGFKLVGIFDNAPQTIGRDINGIKVQSVDELENFIEEHRVDIGILTVPKAGVHDVAYRLVNSGVKALLNFSYKELDLPKDIAVENIHLSDPLMTLSYKLKEGGTVSK